MKYDKIIEQLKARGCKRILVTGAHRNGTTFSAYAIAADMGILFFKEENIRGGSDVLLKAFNQHHKEYVLQAPGYSERAHLFDFDAVVFINRNESDTLESMKRLSNKLIDDQTARTKKLMKGKAEGEGLTLPALKLKAFKEVQMPNIKNAFILNYEDLQTHPKFIAKEERKEFNLRQVTKTIKEPKK